MAWKYLKKVEQGKADKLYNLKLLSKVGWGGMLLSWGWEMKPRDSGIGPR